MLSFANAPLRTRVGELASGFGDPLSSGAVASVGAAVGRGVGTGRGVAVARATVRRGDAGALVGAAVAWTTRAGSGEPAAAMEVAAGEGVAAGALFFFLKRAPRPVKFASFFSAGFGEGVSRGGLSSAE